MEFGRGVVRVGAVVLVDWRRDAKVIEAGGKVIKVRVVEDVAVGGVEGEDGVEGCVACGDDGQRSCDSRSAVPVCQVVGVSQRLELRAQRIEGPGARGLVVGEEDNGLFGSLAEDTSL